VLLLLLLLLLLLPYTLPASWACQVPVKIPPGMPADQAQGIIAYLQANPEAAKAAWAQAQSLLATPGLANAFVNMQVRPCVGCGLAQGVAQLGRELRRRNNCSPIVAVELQLSVAARLLQGAGAKVAAAVWLASADILRASFGAARPRCCSCAQYSPRQ
jgi:hypothetical protein